MLYILYCIYCEQRSYLLWGRSVRCSRAVVWVQPPRADCGAPRTETKMRTVNFISLISTPWLSSFYSRERASAWRQGHRASALVWIDDLLLLIYIDKTERFESLASWTGLSSWRRDNQCLVCRCCRRRRRTRGKRSWCSMRGSRMSGISEWKTLGLSRFK